MEQVLHYQISNRKLVTERLLRGMFSTQRVSIQLKENTKATVDEEVSKIRPHQMYSCTHLQAMSLVIFLACKSATHSTEGNSESLIQSHKEAQKNLQICVCVCVCIIFSHKILSFALIRTM